MTAKIDQKTYLQKYLSGSSNEKKKKKKKVVKGKGLRIVDDDIDLSKLRPLEHDELDVFGEGEDAPQVAGIIDERPEEVKKLEQFKTSSKWRVISQDDGFNSKLQIEEIKKDIVEQQKDNELIFGKMYSDSEDEKDTNKQSPPTKKSKKPQNNSDSDFSPPRRNNKEKIPKAKVETKTSGYDSDLSPPRKHESNTEKPKDRKKPSRWGDNKDSSQKIYSNSQKHSKRRSVSPKKPSNYDSDNSPPRKKTNYDSDSSPPRKQKSSGSNRTKNYDSDLAPPRRHKKKDLNGSPSRKRKNYESDLSPPRKQKSSGSNRKKDYDSDLSPPRRQKRKDSDESPPRKRKNYDSDSSPPRNQKSSGSNRKKGYDSDLSPPRKQKRKDSDESPPRKSNKQQRNRSPDSDLSPPRKRGKSPEQSQAYGYRNRKENRYSKSDKSQKSPEKLYQRKTDSDSDLSPPRRDRQRRNNDSPPPSNKKMAARTLDGKKAGLSDAAQLRQENESFRRREDEAFKNMTDEVSGRIAQAVSRKKKRETSEDRQKQEEKAKRQKELDEKYKKWSKGIKQVEAQEARVAEFVHEASKPLARHRDDRDLDAALKQVDREGDPMLAYIRDKKRERGELPPERPTYKGNFPPNRFNIRPGYRWDGVDRSNGYEKKYFEQQSKKKAMQEEAYKWASEDL